MLIITSAWISQSLHKVMETDNQQLAQTIADHVLKILDAQDQLKTCQQTIRQFMDAIVEQEHKQKSLTAHIHELRDVLDYAVSNHRDPIQIIMTLTRQEIAGSARQILLEQEITDLDKDYLNQIWNMPTQG